MLKQGDRVQLVDHWRLPAVGDFVDEDPREQLNARQQGSSREAGAGQADWDRFHPPRGCAAASQLADPADAAPAAWRNRPGGKPVHSAEDWRLQGEESESSKPKT